MRKISKITRLDYAKVELQNKGENWILILDDVPLCSDEGRLIANSSEALMHNIANEWEEQNGTINLNEMPLTRLLASVLDLNDTQMQNMRKSMMEYAGNEMLAMRDEQNQHLYATILQKVEKFLDVQYELHTQLISPPQPAKLLAKVQNWLTTLPPKTLLTHYVLTQTLGSFALSIAVIHLQLEPIKTIAASWLEHDLQMQKWGEDEALLQKRHADEKQLLNCLVFHNNH
jgi:chaperone required for assembly of F1-ATPase